MTMTPVTPPSSPASVDLAAAQDARRLVALAKPIADAILGADALLAALPALQRAVASLQQREAQLRAGVAEAERIAAHALDQHTMELAALDDALLARRAEHKAATEEMDAAHAHATDTHAKAMTDLRASRKKAEDDVVTAMAKSRDEYAQLVLQHGADVRSLLAEIERLTKTRDGLKKDIDALKAKYG